MNTKRQSQTITKRQEGFTENPRKLPMIATGYNFMCACLMHLCFYICMIHIYIYIYIYIYAHTYNTFTAYTETDETSWSILSVVRDFQAGPAPTPTASSPQAMEVENVTIFIAPTSRIEADSTSLA